MSTHGIRCAGHEGAGVVVKLGSNVADWKIGDRGGLKPLFDVCHNCKYKLILFFRLHDMA